jgi:hypothetical protein
MTPLPVPIASGAVPVILTIVVLLLSVALLERAAMMSVGWASLIWIVIVEARCVRVEVSVVVVVGREVCAQAKLEKERVERVRRHEGRMVDVACARNVNTVDRRGARARKRCVAGVVRNVAICFVLFCRVTPVREVVYVRG